MNMIFVIIIVPLGIIIVKRLWGKQKLNKWCLRNEDNEIKSTNAGSPVCAEESRVELQYYSGGECRANVNVESVVVLCHTDVDFKDLHADYKAPGVDVGEDDEDVMPGLRLLLNSEEQEDDCPRGASDVSNESQTFYLCQSDSFQDATTQSVDDSITDVSSHGSLDHPLGIQHQESPTLRQHSSCDDDPYQKMYRAQIDEFYPLD